MKTAKIVEELIEIKIALKKNSLYVPWDVDRKIDSLIEKLCKSGEDKSNKLVSKSHHNNCMLEVDPEYYGPCTCYKYDASDYDLSL